MTVSVDADKTGIPTAGSIARQLRLSSPGKALTIIPAGDSITQADSTFASGLWQWSSGYAEGGILRAGPRFRILRNAGVAGNTAANLEARLFSDVIAYAPDACLLMIGTNDLTSGMANSAYTALMNTVERIILALLNARILPIIVTPPPKDAAATEAKNAQWYYYALAQYYGLPLIDVYRVLVNPQTGAYASGMSSDGVHPIAAGVAVMQSQVATALAGMDTLVCPPYLAAVSDATVNNFANRLANGSFARVTSSPTPDTWTVNATNATQTVPAVTAGAYTGNTFTYNKTLGSIAFALSGAGASSAGGSFSDGDTMQFNGRIKTSGLTPSTASGYQLTLTASGGGLLKTNNWKQNGDHVISWEFTVPAGTTTLTPSLFVQDVALYEVNNLTLFNVTKANAIWRPGQQ